MSEPLHFTIEKELKHFDVIDQVSTSVLKSEDGLWIAQGKNNSANSRFYMVTTKGGGSNNKIWCNTYDFINGHVLSRVDSIANFIQNHPNDEDEYEFALSELENLYQASRIVTIYPISCAESAMIKSYAFKYDQDNLLHWWEHEFYMYGFLWDVLNFVYVVKRLFFAPKSEDVFPELLAHRRNIERQIEQYNLQVTV